ncbi:discoidin domain-containing protein [Actinacidiphila acididurans]|uniref:Probable beta-glucosidase G n=1 Tax=Actinacidiphila acididurans TaxID=2784346 RepID=A0ABS2TQI1_9ACTN|nr:discoidin domain-containing protein [Actinacidiphila acididurans]MBM9505261.1 discoidin domain-containing protein [Actinacidiphila acididurans]
MHASARATRRVARQPLVLWQAAAVVLALIAALFSTSGSAHADVSLLSQGRPATASSTENAGTPASAAVDGNTGTRWSSAASDPQWLQVDLGASATVSQVVLNWETAYATAFQIQVSSDASTWTSVYSTTTGTGGTQTLNVSGTGRYVRMYGTARATGYGYSLWEFQVYGTGGSGGTGGTCGTQNAAQNQPATASSTENAGTPASAAVDGNTGTRWSSAASDPQWLQVDLGSSVPVCQVILNWETAYATAFQIQVSTDGTTWTPVYSTTTGTGGTQTLNVSGTGRYVRMYGTARGTGYGYSLWEFQVHTGGSGTTGGGTGGTTGGTTGGGTGGNCGPNNAALGHPVTASSIQDNDPGYSAYYAVDGADITRWASAASDPQWLQVDLGAALPVCQVVLRWENAYATGFQIQLSNDGANWTSVYSTTTGTGGVQSVNVTGTGRYIRMYGTARATAYGYSLWDFEVYTVGGVTATIPPPPSQPAPGNCPWINSTAATSTRVAQLMGQMTLQQKVSMLHGTNDPDYIGKIVGIPSLCIPDLNLEDGPSGVGDGLGGVTQMPDGMASAATFDTAWQRAYGNAVGEEFAGKGVNVALGPTINIVRDPRWGRSYETYGEDPYLSGQMGSADILGIQDKGVMAEVKHAAAYNIEQPAGTINVDARTLQEIYLPAFQTSIKQGGAAAVMCAYSNVNNVPSCQNPDILNKGLYQQAGFTGFVTSDWGAIHSTVESANAGLTVEMPSGYYYADYLIQAVQNGQVSQATLDTMVSRVLTQMFRFGMFDKAPTGNTKAVVTTPAHRQVALQGVEEGTVLLKNNGTLPLNSGSLSSLAVIGVDAGPGTQTIGGGSGTVTSSGTYTPLVGIQERLAGTNTKVTYNDGSDVNAAAALAQSSGVAVVFASDNYGHEEADNPSLNLPNNQDALISAVAAANPHTIVVLNNNSTVLMPWLNQVAGVFEGFYDGQEYGQGIAALLFGDVNPSGHLPVTFPTSLSQVPANTTAQWPGQNGAVDYSEGLKVGYRWYDSNNLTPLFPFGYGLSYTSFSFGNLQVGALNNGQATVTATVTNTGSRAGTDVAQLYVGDPASAGEPPHQLKGFQRITLNPGASGTVTFTVKAHDLASWSTTAGHWVANAGTYQILVGDSSRNLPLSGNLNNPTTVTAD